MNYITRLQAELAAARSELDAKYDALRDFRCHIAGKKFQGFEPDGTRKDWIAIADVDARLRDIIAAGIP
jgi:hypothetical protein